MTSYDHKIAFLNHPQQFWDTICLVCLVTTQYIHILCQWLDIDYLDNAILFAQQYINIPEKDLRLIKHCRKSLLYNNNEPWKNKNIESCFDVTMGSFHGTEICELVGIHILSSLSNKLDEQSTGLYRDDGLVLLRNTSKQKTDRIRKDIIEIFENAGFKIEIKANLHIADFLDVTYKPYKKPNDQLRYVNTSSHHPPQIIKKINQIILQKSRFLIRQKVNMKRL